MKLDLHLADSASVDDRSKIYALGLGWTVTSSPTPAFAVLLVIELEPEEVPADLEFQLELVGEGDAVARFPAQQSEEKGRPVIAGGQLQAPPLPADYPGDPLRLPLVVNFQPGIILEAGRYRFKATVTRESESLHAVQGFRVRLPDESIRPGIPLEARLQGNSERSEIEITASKLGFQISRNIATLTDTYERPNRSVRVRYDRAGKVLDVLTAEGSAHPANLDTALAALQLDEADLHT